MELAELTRTTQAADADIAAARQQIVDAARAAYRVGYSQRQIAQAMQRSQPEVNRLIRFHGTSAAAMSVRKHRAEILRILRDHSLKNPRIFGSVARGEDGEESDVDLLVTRTQPMGLLALAGLEDELSETVGRRVDLVFDDAIRMDLADNILNSAVPL